MDTAEILIAINGATKLWEWDEKDEFGVWRSAFSLAHDAKAQRCTLVLDADSMREIQRYAKALGTPLIACQKTAASAPGSTDAAPGHATQEGA